MIAGRTQLWVRSPEVRGRAGAVEQPAWRA